VNKLDESISQINKLGDDKNHTYDLVSSGDTQNRVTLGDDGVINIQGGNEGQHIHEIDHVARSLDSKAGLKWGGGILLPTTFTGEKDEISGYQHQYSYDPYTMPKHADNIGSINQEWVGTIKNSDGSFLYPAINHAMLNAQKQERINKRMFKKQGNE
jgi:hypothetical protein